MDILAHALWNGAIYEASSFPGTYKPRIAWAVFFGVAPDLLSFGILFLQNFLTRWTIHPPFVGEHGYDAALVPDYIHTLYNYTHSYIIFFAAFFAVWLLARRPWWELGGWGLHILLDIPTHNSQFFPTPFLWPVSSLAVNGTSWATPVFMVVNYATLVVLYITLYYIHARRNGRSAR